LVAPKVVTWATERVRRKAPMTVAASAPEQEQKWAKTTARTTGKTFATKVAAKAGQTAEALVAVLGAGWGQLKVGGLEVATALVRVLAWAVEMGGWKAGSLALGWADSWGLAVAETTGEGSAASLGSLTALELAGTLGRGCLRWVRMWCLVREWAEVKVAVLA